MTSSSGSTIPYGRHWIDDADIEAIVEVLHSDWLTTGPKVEEFERRFAEQVGTREAVAVNSGTAALHAALRAARIGPGDEVLVPAMTFAATANAVLYCGATPIFVDVRADTLLIDPAQVERLLTPRTRCIMTVDYAGQPCDYDAIRQITDRHGLMLVADACHALGAEYRGRRVGSLADLSTFSFHPVKHIATGEGGMIATDNPDWAQFMRCFRNHGITTDARQREQTNSWFYEMIDLGFNYRISDMQCALGLSQLKKLMPWVERRRAIAARYDAAFRGMKGLTPLAVQANGSHTYHLYVVRVQHDRGGVFKALRAAGIGVNVHYLPVHLHPYYRKRLGTGPGLCPVAEEAYEIILSLPIFPRLSDAEVDYIIQAVRQVLERGGTP